jgi:hypothetical protein
MALSSKSLFVYGLTVTTLNQNIDFQNVSSGPVLTAQIALGFYSPQSLAQAVALAIQSVDATNIYSVTVNTNIAGGTQNRITIATNGTFLSLLFSSGPNATTSAASLMGFNPTDYTGATSYTGSASVGTTLIPDFIGYSFLNDLNTKKVFGAVNVSASGLKEAVTFNIQLFIQVDFKYEAKANLLNWQNLFAWLIQQKTFDFTPEISIPDAFFTCTLESTDYDKQGLGYQMKEMLPDFPNFYETGTLIFRITPNTSQFIQSG